MYSWKAFTDNRKRVAVRHSDSIALDLLAVSILAMWPLSPVRVTFKPTIGKLQLLGQSGMSRADQVAVQGGEKDANRASCQNCSCAGFTFQGSSTPSELSARCS